MSKFLSNVKDLKAFRDAVDKCKGDVILRKNDGSEEFNMHSQLSSYVAWNKLSQECGTDYEIFCMNKSDEINLLKYFYEKTR